MKLVMQHMDERETQTKKLDNYVTDDDAGTESYNYKAAEARFEN